MSINLEIQGLSQPKYYTFSTLFYFDLYSINIFFCLCPLFFPTFPFTTNTDTTI